MLGEKLTKGLKLFILLPLWSDSVYSLASPLTMVLSLCAIFYVDGKPNSSKVTLNFLLLRHIPGWMLFVNTYYQLFNKCSIYSYTCALPLFLNTSFVPICLATERHLRDLFNALEDIDSRLRALGVKGVINKRHQWLRLYALMVVHLIWITFLVQYSKTYSRNQWAVQLSIIYMAIQRRFNFIWYQFLCEQLQDRFRLIESVWTTEDAHTMEQVRLLYQRARQTIQHLSRAFGPRLLFMLFDINLQCTKFFIFTFVIPMETAIMPFVIFFLYHYYCVHVTTTASNSLADKSRCLLSRLANLPLCKMDEGRKIQVQMFWIQIESSPIEVTMCGCFSYNRALLLTMMNGMVSVWVLLVQTAPAVVTLLTKINEGGN